MTGTVNLILCDGATLDVKNIRLTSTSAVLNIYAQEGNTGALNAIATTVHGAAGIGGTLAANGTVNIYGGVITAKGGTNAAGIGGGGNGGKGGTILIQRATVNATGGLGGAGIGAGIYSGGGNITINSGTVTAKGGNGAAGIGNGYECGNGGDYAVNITINAGTVNATGGTATTTNNSTTLYYSGAGIGGGGSTGSRYTQGTIAINGGNVTANGCSHRETHPKMGIVTVIDSAGIGCGTGGSSIASRPLYLYLGWDKSTDSVYATTYNVYSINFNDDFILQGTTTPATDSNVDGKTIVPIIVLYDVNEDGYFDVNDVAFVMSAAVGEIEMTQSQQAKADVDGDGYIDGFDAAILDRKLLLF